MGTLLDLEGCVGSRKELLGGVQIASVCHREVICHKIT
jgi:hypothetical protein